MSAYLSPAGELADAEAYRSGGNGRPIRLSAAARAHALKEARAAVLLRSAAKDAAVPPVAMSDEEAADLARRCRDGLGSAQVTLWPGRKDF